MKLDILLNVNPELYDAYMELFEEILKNSAERFRNNQKDLMLKFAEPDDIIFGGTHNKYNDTYSAYIESNIFNIVGYNCVPTQMEAIFIGWYCNVKGKGLLSVRLEGIDKHKISINDVYNNKNPLHYYFTTTIVHFRENDRLDFSIYNDEDIDLTGEIYPLVILISTKRRFGDKGFLPRKMNISNPNNYELLLTKLEERYNLNPLEFVQIKNKDNEEETEIRAKLDPDFEEWLKTLKGGEICQFCGAKITRIQTYCHYCGVPLNNLTEALEQNKNIINGV